MTPVRRRLSPRTDRYSALSVSSAGAARLARLRRSQRVPASLAKTTAAAAGWAVVAADDVAHSRSRFQFRHRIEESAAESVVEGDL